MKRIIKIGILIVFLIVVFGCSTSINDEYIKKEIQEQLNEMTLEQKIAQMLITYQKKTDITDEYIETLKQYQVGGVILFDDDLTNYHDTKRKIYNIYSETEIPMFISIDQEGGKVQRLQSITNPKATFIPDMKVIGDYNDLNISYSIGTIIGEESRSLGINTVFAPVLDTGNYKTSSLQKRIISSKPSVVSSNGIKIAEGISDSGVIPVYKHFPGIANTKIDSHKELPVIDKSLDELYKEELIPFIDAIKNDYYKPEMIMVGHVNFPKVTNDSLPASLSKIIVKELLRDELNYDGVVITDAINMKALTNNFSEQEIFELGINASVDIFLMPSDISKSINAIIELINENKVSEQQINDAVERILLLKKKRLTNFTSLDEGYFASSEHNEIIKNIK